MPDGQKARATSEVGEIHLIPTAKQGDGWVMIWAG